MVDQLGMNTLAHFGVLEALGEPCVASVAAPARELHGQAGGAGRVGILVERNVDAARHGRIDHGEQVYRAALHGSAHDFGVRDLAGQAAFLGNADQLRNAVEDAEVFVAHVADVNAVILSGNAREFDQLFGVGETARDIDQAGRQAESAFAHRLRHCRAHGVQFPRCGGPVVEADNVLADCSMTDECPVIDGRRAGFDSRKMFAQRQW